MSSTKYISLSAAHRMAVALGSGTFFHDYKKAVMGHPIGRKNIRLAGSGARRQLFEITEEAAQLYAPIYAAEHPHVPRNNSKRVAELAAPVEHVVVPGQMSLDFSEPDPLPRETLAVAATDHILERMNALEVKVDALATKLDKLLLVWDAMEDDQK